MWRTVHFLLCCIVAIGATATVRAGDPVLEASYGWEDGKGTIIGSTFQSSITALNVGDFVFAGRRALRITESPHVSGTPHIYLAHIRNLEQGDLVRAGFWTFDDSPQEAPRVRIWAHYTFGDSTSPVTQAGGNQTYSAGVGWEELSHEWLFDSNNGQHDGLIVQARLYSPACPPSEVCTTDYWVDDVWIEVFDAAHPELEVVFPDAFLPEPPCKPDVSGEYGWEDGEETILGSNKPTLLTAANVSDWVHTGDHALHLTQAPNTPNETVHVYLAHITGLQPGDEITARFWTYDEAFNTRPFVRIWAHYTDGESIGPVNQAGGNSTESAGIGWQELSHSWTFGDNPNWSGLVIQARLFTAECDGGDPASCITEFHFDDISIEVCAADPDSVSILFPDSVKPVPPPCPKPNLSTTYGWEDGEGTIIGGTFLASVAAANVDDFTHTGLRALKVTESPNASGTPEVWLAHIRNLQDGDTVDASFWTYDAAPLAQPRVRIWAHYTHAESVNSVGTAGGNTEYSLGIGWEEIGHTWSFDSAGGTRDGLVIQARLYSPGCPPGETCATEYWFDDVTVSVCAADATTVSIIFPDEFDPKIPDPPPACTAPSTSAVYDWEDGDGTIIGGTFSNSIAAVNNDDPEYVLSGLRSLRITESPHVSATPQVWLAHIRNLQDGDVVDASFWTLDTVPGTTPRVRIWAHYTSGSDPGPVPQGSAGGSSTFSAGIGWEKLSHAWKFDSAGGTRDGLVIQARLYSSVCPDGEICATDYWIDDIVIDVCTPHPQNIVVFFPDTLAPEPPIEMCDEPMWGEYGWEDGGSSIIGASSSAISANPTQELVNTGSYALKITELPSNVGAREVYLAFVENLQHGDTIHASFFAFDDTPGINPRVRIWGRYGYTGDPVFLQQSAGGNEQWTTGIGWEELSHTWEFSAGAGFPPRDALMIMARVYAAPCDENNPGWIPQSQICATHYFLDDLLVEACGDHPNLTITLPDGTIIGDPTPQKCLPDVNGSTDVGLFDILTVLSAWGTADPNADVNGDGIVDGADLGIVLASLGPCEDVLPPMPGTASLLLESSVAPGGLTQLDLFVELKSETDAIVNIYDASITSTLGFEGGSFFTIGATPQHFDVFEDPNFDLSGFASGTSLGTDAGWFNLNPSNNIGMAGLYPGNKVLIARFYVEPKTMFEASLSLTYEDSSGRPRQTHLSLEPKPTPCPGDLTGNGGVGVPDLLALLGCWGPVVPGGTCTGADLTNNGSVGVPDLLSLLSAWGECP